MKTVDLKLEVIAIPVADIERAKRFYGDSLGWRLDADFAAGNEFRGVQFTPPGSPCSIHFGKGVTPAAPGSVPASHAAPTAWLPSTLSCRKRPGPRRGHRAPAGKISGR